MRRALALIALAGLVGCTRPAVTATDARLGRIDQAMAAGTKYLRGRQSPDGAWRSEVYGHFRAGDALTPLALDALLALPGVDPADPDCTRAADYLAALARPAADAADLNYPVYTAALAAQALSRPGLAHHGAARDAWLARLLDLQLTETNGWKPSDPSYGGWGFAVDRPVKPAEGPIPTALVPNLSATAVAVDALRAAGRAADRPAIAQAGQFARRCQNYTVPPKQPAAWEDGGFFFVAADAERNKAGVAGRDAEGREQYFSYGSTTADGLRVLLAGGAASDPERIAAARGWLTKHFAAATHPGPFAPESEPKREAVYFYYAWSLTRTLEALADAEGGRPEGWADALADELVRRQQADGAWANADRTVREDDPVVATAFALRALAVCRAGLSARER